MKDCFKSKYVEDRSLCTPKIDEKIVISIFTQKLKRLKFELCARVKIMVDTCRKIGALRMLVFNIIDGKMTNPIFPQKLG